MKLKPCKITKLDDTFWRVDWEGEPRQWYSNIEGSRTLWSPLIVRYVTSNGDETDGWYISGIAAR